MGRALVLGIALSAVACTNFPRPQPPRPPQPTPTPPEPQCAEGQACGCWHRPPDAQGWLYACCQPGVPGGVVNVQDPAQCIAQPPVCKEGEVLQDGVCVAKPGPGPTPPPTNVPPKGEPQGPERLLRNEANQYLRTNDGKRFDPFGAESCCDAWAKCPEDQGTPYGTGWPIFSQCWMDQTHLYGANLYHARVGPWFGTMDYETLWSNVGGAYNTDGSWNEAFWSKFRELVWVAYERRQYVEVVPIDDWWLKGACGRDRDCGKQVPWLQTDVEAWGKRPSPAAEALYRKTVEEVGCFGNVIWTTGNEEDLIPGVTVEHLNWRISTLRNAENAVGCNFAHLIGTGSFKDGVKADYQITHEKAAVTGPCHGLLCANNEHNPEYSPEQEASYFKTARDAGQRWDAWRGGASDANWEKRLKLFQDVVAGGSAGGQCYAPDAEDPKWLQPPMDPAQRPPQMMAAINQAKAAVGNRCGATAPCTEEPCAPPIHLGCLETNGLIAAELRKQGYCASGPWTDATAVLAPDGIWEEYHVCSTGDGCYTGHPYKYGWKYGGTNPTPPGPQPTPGQCTNPAPKPIDHWNLKEHTKGPNKTVVDSTPIVHDAAYCREIGFTDGRIDCPVRMEGDPLRPTCEAVVVGTPQWTGPPTGSVSPDNPYQFWVPRGVLGNVTVCTSVTPKVCGTLAMTP